MVLRIRQVHDVVGGRADADDAFAHAQACQADRIRAQAVGGDQLQHVAMAQDVDGANLRLQLPRGQPHDVGQRGCARGHHLAQTGEQPARPSHRQTTGGFGGPLRGASAGWSSGSKSCLRLANAATAWATNSSMISGTRSYAVTMPTDCPALTAPWST